MQPHSDFPDGRPARPLGDGQAADLRELMRRAAQGALRGSDATRAPDGEVRQLLRRACDLAREQGLYAEHLLIVVKRAWGEIPEARQLPRAEAGALLGSVITLCIDEYYRSERLERLERLER